MNTGAGGGSFHMLEKQWTFRDNVRSIDYVLAWESSSSQRRSTLSNNTKYRYIFQKNLQEQGLELELESNEELGLNFVKIHAPQETLIRYAELLQLRLPLKDIGEDSASIDYKSDNSASCWECFTCCCQIDKEVFPDVETTINAPFNRAKSYLFNINDPEFFKPLEKARIINFILQRTLYSEKTNDTSEVFEFGIQRLLLSRVYTAAYPLHDGDLDTPNTVRNRLYNHWATFGSWYSYQPLDHIRQYFGAKIAIYFAWLGFYIKMLFPAAIFGVLCIIVSLFVLGVDESFEEICSGAIKEPMCPLCDYYCNFWKPELFCFHKKLSFIFDNYVTVIFAAFMSFWSATFIQGWKRHVSQITYHWDLTWLDESYEIPRAEYAAKLNSMLKEEKSSNKINVVSSAYEPSLNYWKTIFPAKALSFVTILFLVTLAIATVIAITTYKIIAMATVTSLHLSPKITPVVYMITSFTATFFNLICIFIFSWIYSHLAEKLTKLELPRSQREYDSSYTLKLYMLEFVNNYSSIFFIAFFKGQFTGYPNHYNRIFGFRQSECGYGGCMWELTLQLGTIMVGKRVLKSLLEYFRPFVTVKLRKITWGAFDTTPQWEKDYFLVEAGPGVLIPDYLDMVLQYGFVTIFVAAFPLAPLFALVCNIFEIRIDAKNLLVWHRRPCTQRVKTIGVWRDIIQGVSRFAIISNGIIIAFTSNVIPKLVYKYYSSPDQSLKGFMNNSLSYMKIEDLDMYGIPQTNQKYCRYFGHKEPPWSENKYAQTIDFWHVLAARLLFFVIFENTIMVFVIIFKWIIPEVPGKVKLYMRRRNHLISETIIKSELSNPSQRTKIEEHDREQKQSEDKRGYFKSE